MDVKNELDEFIRKSERVVNVTHMPKQTEYNLIAKSTALGILVIGLIGFIIATIFRILS